MRIFSIKVQKDAGFDARGSGTSRTEVEKCTAQIGTLRLGRLCGE
jgi:hypothetical protein